MIAYVDGSCRPNPGPGGYGIVLLDDDERLIRTYRYDKENTTNNEMELMAILNAAVFAKIKNEPLTIYSDSSYAIGCLSNWMYSWERNGWVKSDNKIPENLKLIQSYYSNFKDYDITFKKVKGHAGNFWNEIADKLATGEIKYV